MHILTNCSAWLCFRTKQWTQSVRHVGFLDWCRRHPSERVWPATENWVLPTGSWCALFAVIQHLAMILRLPRNVSEPDILWQMLVDAVKMSAGFGKIWITCIAYLSVITRQGPSFGHSADATSAHLVYMYEGAAVSLVLEKVSYIHRPVVNCSHIYILCITFIMCAVLSL